MSSLSTRETDRLSVDGHLFFPVKTVKTNHTEITEAEITEAAKGDIGTDNRSQ